MKELFAALVKAQAQMGGAVRDSANPFFKSKYADLASVMEAIRPAFAAHGLGFIQVIHDAENCACVETLLIHESGETFACGKVSVPVSKADAQGYGSAITYAKRYSLQSAVGVPSVDDDGNAAARAAVPVKAPPKLQIPPCETQDYIVTAERAEELYDAAACCIDKFRQNDKEGAYDEISGITSNGEKLFLWATLKEFSAVRAYIKSRWQNGQTTPAEATA
jgi:hypothetical protein